MKISIGISCYNQAEFLPEALESAFNQTVPCEVIAVDDGSPDKTLEILEHYKKLAKEKGIEYKVIHQVNKGLASARNTAIINMSGDIFLPLDADDILFDECAEKIIKVFQESEVDIVAPSFKCFGIGNDVIILDTSPRLEDFRTGNRIPYFSAVKKEALLECGGYSPRMIYGYEDYHLWFDLLSRGKKVITIPEPLVFYRTKKVSMWKDAMEHHKELMEQIFKDFPQVWPK